jgi:hypothetical protein
MLTEKRMKRVPNRNFALVTGIMTCRVKRELQRNGIGSRFRWSSRFIVFALWGRDARGRHAKA